MQAHRTEWTLAVIAVCSLFAGCSATEEDRPERSERERDSLISESILPGAGGVRGALRAQDSASARAARLDSIAKSNPN